MQNMCENASFVSLHFQIVFKIALCILKVCFVSFGIFLFNKSVIKKGLEAARVCVTIDRGVEIESPF